MAVHTEILRGPLPPWTSTDDRPDDGSELLFQGRVRGEEHGRSIVGLDYEHYEGMAEQQLQSLAEQAAERFPISSLDCWHRVGLVPVGEASLRVVIWSPHRAEGLACLAWFISELKLRVPIWKWAVTTDGERFASHCDHEH